MRKLSNYNINLNYLFSIVMVYSFGLFGTIGRIDFAANVLITCLVSYSVYHVMIKVRTSYFRVPIDKTLFVLLTVLLFILAADLILPLSDDPIFHIYFALQPSIEITRILGDKNLIDINGTLKPLLIIINSLIIIIMFFFLKIFSRKKFFLTVIFIISLILLRIIVLKMGGGVSQHPPFRNFPLWITGTLGGFSTFGFRAQGFVALLILARLLFNQNNSILLTLTISSLPLLLHTSTIVEFSIWYILGSVLMILRINKVEQKDIIKDALIITIFVFLRQTSVCLIFFILYKILFLRKKCLNLKLMYTLIFTLLPPILFVFFSATNENPAMTIDNNIKNIIFFNLKLIPELYIRDIGFIYLILFLISVFVNKNKLFLIFLLLINVILFSKVPTFGVPRYQAEIFIPIMLVTINNLFSKVKMKQVLIILIIYNLYVFTYKWKTIAINNYKNPIISEKLYNYNEAIKYLKNNYSLNSLAIRGLEYKGIVLILNGSSYYELKEYNILKNDKEKINNANILIVEDRFMNEDGLNLTNYQKIKSIKSEQTNDELFIYKKI